MEHYQEDLSNFPTTLIYFNSKTELNELTRWLISNAPKPFKTRIVNYHAKIGDKNYRLKFLEEFLKNDSEFSIICSTSALGQVLQ